MSLGDDDFLLGVQIRTLGDGDVIWASWCDIADSGVRVVRLAGEDGRILFDRRCAPLGVPHSKYRHRTYLEIADERAVVVSQASAGAFVEVLDLTDGRSLARHRRDR